MSCSACCSLLHFCDFFPPPLQHFPLWLLGKNLKAGRGVLHDFDLFSFYPMVFLPVPSGPPRKVEVEALNSSSVKVIWRSPMPTKQHGQIRGYQVHYVRMLNGEPTGQPAIKDILIDDAQVRHHLRQMDPFFSLSCKSLIWTFRKTQS